VFYIDFYSIQFSCLSNQMVLLAIFLNSQCSVYYYMVF
jgi:hypothetical protein